MECFVFFIFVVVIIAGFMLHNTSKNDKERQKHIDEETNQKIEMCKGRFSDGLCHFDNQWRKIFVLCEEPPHRADMRRVLAELEKENNELSYLGADITYTWKLKPFQKMVFEYENHCEKMSSFPITMMMDTECYGSINKEYWKSVRSFTTETAGQLIEDYEQRIASNDAERIFSVDMDQLLRCIWFYGTDKPYCVESFNRAVNMFHQLYMRNTPVMHAVNKEEVNPARIHLDIKLAECYTIKQIGGNDILHDRIQKFLALNMSSTEMEAFASGLMWMQAYAEELEVLKNMLSKGIAMSAKAQERLRALTNGGGRVPGCLDVSDNRTAMHCDMSSLTWKDDEYAGFFESLAFREQILTYALAVRDETKELSLPNGATLWNKQKLLQKLQALFIDEYEDVATIETKECIAHSGASKEKMECILAKSAQCSPLGILVYIVRVGKHINIKFYTLFLPTNAGVNQQKEQALSLYNKLSPTVSMWESSMKDTVLTGIQQILNFRGQDPIVIDETPPKDEPVF